MRPTPYLVLVLPLLVGCETPAVEFTDAMKAEIAAEVEAAADAWWEAWEAVDYDRGMTFFLDSPDAAWTGDDGTVYTVAGMNDKWEGVWGTEWAQQEITFTDTKTIVLAPDIAYTIRGYQAVVTDTAGVVRPPTNAVETLVWVEREGEWKVLLGHEATLEDSWQTIIDQGGW